MSYTSGEISSQTPGEARLNRWKLWLGSHALFGCHKARVKNRSFLGWKKSRRSQCWGSLAVGHFFFKFSDGEHRHESQWLLSPFPPEPSFFVRAMAGFDLVLVSLIAMPWSLYNFTEAWYRLRFFIYFFPDKCWENDSDWSRRSLILSLLEARNWGFLAWTCIPNFHVGSDPQHGSPKKEIPEL